MSFDWGDYLKLAEALQRDPSSPGPEEASLRTALSRLRNNRNKADYEDVFGSRPVDSARSSVALARNVLATLGSL